MSNVIRHKRGTSNPAAGDFSDTAELLVNTTDGGLFTKTDGGSVVEIGGGVAFNDLTGKTSGTGDYSTNGDVVSGRGSGGVALTINDGHGNANVTWNHQDGVPEQNGNAARIEVNTDASTNAQMYFELKSGVTANTNTTLTNILTLSEGAVSALKPLSVTGNITVSGTVDGRDVAADGSKLDGIESGATADQTASEILTAIKTVDGSGSGLDADLLDGQQGSYYQPASSALTTSTSFGGDVSGTYNAITVADDSHNHVVSNVDGLQSSLDAKANLSGATFTGEVQINARLDVGAPGSDHEIRVYKSDNNVSDHIQFYNGTTRVGEIGCEDTTWLRINQETSKNIYTPRYIRADAGFFVDGTTKGINGSGNFIGGTIAGASDYGTLLRSNANDTATGILTFNAACRGQVDALSSASTITPNFNNSNNFSLTLATNTTINNPSNLVAGQSGAITIYYSGNRTVAFGSYWKFPGGTAPTMTSTSGKYDVIVYYVESSSRISAQVLLNTGG